MANTNFEMCMAALQRPPSYNQLHAERQWEIDKSLGILDWDGINLDDARKIVEAGNIQDAARRFKMNLTELGQVLKAFDAKFPPTE